MSTIHKRQQLLDGTLPDTSLSTTSDVVSESRMGSKIELEDFLKIDQGLFLIFFASFIQQVLQQFRNKIDHSDGTTPNIIFRDVTGYICHGFVECAIKYEPHMNTKKITGSFDHCALNPTQSHAV